MSGVEKRVETDVDTERGERAGVETERGERASVETETVYLCDLCGHPMLDLHCKLICERCGYKRDCSDP